MVVFLSLKTYEWLPPVGRLLRAVPLRIVGSGFCPMVRGLPRAMLAPDASVGKAENMCCQWICVSLNRLNHKLNLF